MHGAQSLDPERARTPLTYYAPASGVGLAFAALPALAGPQARVGVVGLGTGSLACYAAPGQDWSFYEIDPLMVELATDRAVFSFLADCTPDARIVVGDARLKIDEEPDGRFDLLVVDAFSSDAIPVHLLTREAFASYRRVMAPDGVLMLHISNRFLDLEPVVAAIAQELGMAARIRTYLADEEAEAQGFNTSIWVVLTAHEAGMARFLATAGGDARWQPLKVRDGLAAWSDQRASVLPVLKPFMRLY
jgi:spermidine synthase